MLRQKDLYCILCAYFLIQIYILGGVLSNSSFDSVEVLDTDLKTAGPLLGSDGLSIKIPYLVNNIMFCTVGLDDLNMIFVAGGSVGGR